MVKDQKTVTNLSTRDLPLSLRVLFDVLLPSRAGMSGAYQLCVLLESWGDGLGDMNVTLHEFNALEELRVVSWAPSDTADSNNWEESRRANGMISTLESSYKTALVSRTGSWPGQ